MKYYKPVTGALFVDCYTLGTGVVLLVECYHLEIGVLFVEYYYLAGERFTVLFVEFCHLEIVVLECFFLEIGVLLVEGNYLDIGVVLFGCHT